MAAVLDGEKVRTLRAKQGIRQGRLAEKAKISTFWLRQIELHGQQPSPVVLHSIAQALGVDATELMSEP